MSRPLIDRWTDTRTFRFLLLLSALVALPVLAVGFLTTVIAGPVLLLIDRAPIDVEQAVFGLLSVGGAVGFLGYLRAHSGARTPDRHNVTATLLCLAAGVLTALAVASFGVVDSLRSPWTSEAWVALAALFAAANLMWAVSGIAWMQRLRRRYAEHTGHAFDGLPALLLFVAAALATAAATFTATL
jgi:hypothetical protein